MWVQWDTKAGGGGWIESKVFHENVLVPFRIGSTLTIPAGSYDFAELQVVSTMPSGKRVRTDIDLRPGSYFDGRRTQLLLAPTWNINRHFEVGGDYQLNLLRFSARDQSENIHLLRLRLRTALDARASGNAFVQYNSTTDRVDVNVRLRYALAEGTDLWIVYNEGLDTDRAVGQPERFTPLSLSRALVVKYSQTLRF